MKTMYRFSNLVALTILIIGTSICGTCAETAATNASAGLPKTSPAPQAPAEDYIIGADDVLKLSILDVPELSGDYRVSNSGSITLPVLSTPVKAEGLTLTEFSDSMAKNLKAAGLVSDPHISTSVDQSRLHSIAITGAVKKPQVLPIFTQTTLLDVLSQAEGLEDTASTTAIVRRGDVAMRALKQNQSLTSEQYATAQTVTVDLKQLMDNGGSKLNIAIYPGDHITVPAAGIVYVVGAVNKPGGFMMKPSARGMTVLEAIALAEDTKGTAKRNQTVIIRNDPQAPDGRKQIPVELKKVLSGKSPDPILLADDILFIPDNVGMRALHRGLEAALQVTTGVAVYRGR